MGTAKRVKKNKNYMGRNFKKSRVAETLSKAKRSSLMSKIRSKNTKFEEEFIQFASLKISNGFITHVRTLVGTPDMVFERGKVCVFLDSDFWHGWQYPRWKHLLKDDFWRGKIFKNRQRDIRNTRLLKKSGWKVIRIWEHQIKLYPDRAIDRILCALNL